MSELIKVHDLSIQFENQDDINIVVDHVSIDIARGEKVGIVGESGSGKTITSLSILGLLPSKNARYSSGEILLNLDGTRLDLTKISSEEGTKIRGKEISMIFQEPVSSLDPVYKCGHQVDEVYLTHVKKDQKKAKERTIELFKKVKLPDPERIYDSYPHEISGGQIQRVMIAMALVCNPKLLVADEPTTALDVTIQKEIISLLNEITSQLDMSLLFISHDLALVSQICDRVYVMYQGKVVEKGNVKQIFNQPEERYTKALMECRPSLIKRDHALLTVNKMLGDSEDSELQLIARNPSEEILLKAEGVSKTYYKNVFGGMIRKPSTHALKDVSFELRRKEILGVVGESGSGKSTLIKCILGIENVDKGEIVFDVHDLTKLNAQSWKRLRPRIQIVFQDPYSSLNPKMKIGAAVKEALDVIHYHSDKKERVLELFDLVGIDRAMYDRYPHQLSGGQRQRVCIARALAMEPELLLCDESVSALDVSIQAQILNLLLDLREKQDLSIIFITHDFSVVAYLCDRIIVLNEGQIVEEGTPDQILKQPKDSYTQNLIESIPIFAHEQ